MNYLCFSDNAVSTEKAKQKYKICLWHSYEVVSFQNWQHKIHNYQLIMKRNNR